MEDWTALSPVLD